jgi:hypothetical protein
MGMESGTGFPRVSAAKPLNKETLEVLKNDQEIFNRFQLNLTELSCKLAAYQQVKFYYDNEVIDSFLNQTRYKRSFLNLLYNELKSTCDKTSTNDKLVLEKNNYHEYDDKFVAGLYQGFNITKILLKTNEEKEKSTVKEDL